jgi:protein-arginine kinase activator protein McsA
MCEFCKKNPADQLVVCVFSGGNRESHLRLRLCKKCADELYREHEKRQEEKRRFEEKEEASKKELKAKLEKQIKVLLQNKVLKP